MKLFIFLSLVGSVVSADGVEGYMNSSGTYVNPYQRSAPDSSTYNNYNSPGHYNPNTGSFNNFSNVQINQGNQGTEKK